MKQYALIGVSSFGKRILEELILMDCEIILIDKDPEIIEYFKNSVTAAYIADVINEEIVTRLIPGDIDAVVIDLGDKIEASILVTKYLSKLGVSNIIVKAETDQHGEILSIVGADHVIFPNLEAAKRVTPLLVSDLLFNYLPISGGLVIAETGVPENLVGHTLTEVEIRKSLGINVIAFRRAGQGEYQFFRPEYRLNIDDVLLIVGQDEDVSSFTGKDYSNQKRGISNLFSQLFSNMKSKSDQSS
ncbi:MAG: TrkA family potassium uptake protein [Spirochaetes bacterium]|nr:MAG: TrkA family potassium uptake protein [Spirochaetota bacterium]RKX90223.1 MAG: TrkA family potassium uptake protein [Spirochaetota bacterium]RKX98482.1 MAG: TrkA family potassium uptake protein [Spirochaetota bacterium]